MHIKGNTLEDNSIFKFGPTCRKVVLDIGVQYEQKPSLLSSTFWVMFGMESIISNTQIAYDFRCSGGEKIAARKNVVMSSHSILELNKGCFSWIARKGC